MIYDCSIFNGEFQMMTIQMDELRRFGPHVTHITIEGNMTFTGIPREIKLETSHVADLSNGTTPWEREAMQRNSIWMVIEPIIKDDDIVIIRDADEIVRGDVVEKYDTVYRTCALQMDELHLFLNTRSGHQTWRHPKITSGSALRDTAIFNKFPNDIRNGGFDLCMMNAGWHFSWQGSDADILQKFKSFSHQEEEVQRHATPEHIRMARKELFHIINDDDLTVVEMSELPALVQHNPEKFKHMLYVQ